MEELALESNAFFMGIEYLAVFCSGLMGGLCAVRKNYDLFAMLITAWLTALGGGIIRDVMLGSLPPVGISDRGFVLTALVSGLAIAVIHPEVDKLRWSMLTIDALAVGLFAVNGTSKALDLGTSGMTAVFMGMFTALGGGLVRDMLLNDVPMIIRDKHLYAVPSAVGCVLTVRVQGSAMEDAGFHGRGGARLRDRRAGRGHASAVGQVQHHASRRGQAAQHVSSQRVAVSETPGHPS